jgi:hypothetical protein
MHFADRRALRGASAVVVHETRDPIIRIDRVIKQAE